MLECCLDISRLWKSYLLGALQRKDNLYQHTQKAEAFKRITNTWPLITHGQSE